MSKTSLARFFLYEESESGVDLDILHIEPLRERSLRHNWIIHPHAHPQHDQIMLFTKGGARTRIEGSDLALSEGMVAIHPAGMVHDIRYLPDSEGMTITVAGTYVRSITRQTPELAEPLQRAIALDLGSSCARVTTCFDAILHEHRDRAPGWERVISGQFLSLLVHLSRLQPKAGEAAIGRRDLQLAQGFRDLIEQHFAHHKRMDFYARALAISPQRLNAACNSALGYSASALLHGRLMVEAKRHLAYTEMTIAEIGHALGFDDPAYFNRFFTRHAEQPPGAWRRAVPTTTRIARASE